MPAQANVERCAVAAPATGETLTCPFCMGLCISTGLAAGLVFAHSVTRLAAGTLTALPLSDLLRFARVPDARPAARVDLKVTGDQAKGHVGGPIARVPSARMRGGSARGELLRCSGFPRLPEARRPTGAIAHVAGWRWHPPVAELRRGGARKWCFSCC
ncbi:DUF1360 domain-containing protein [Actinacidiphila glaucinigra]|uniref:DUF1360 domain-containing protein n=1 Tax=Actinacidiphila glaucinigra TaxID=235986 RepID=UPI0037891715